MWVIIRWLRNNAYPLTALFLFLFSFNLVLRYQVYQHSLYFNQSVSFFRTVDKWRSSLTQYFDLKEENEYLKEENLILRKQLAQNYINHNPSFDSTFTDTTSSITPSFHGLSSTLGYVGMYSSPFRHATRKQASFGVRLACFSHAASVQSEPGSNSSIEFVAPASQAKRVSVKWSLPGRPANTRRPGLDEPETVRRQQVGFPVAVFGTPIPVVHRPKARESHEWEVSEFPILGITRMFLGQLL